MNTERQRRSKDHRDTGTRQRLVEATQGCLRTRGLADTSSRAITDLAGANLAAITYHFGSKERLVAVALAAELEAWTRPVLELLDEPGDPATRLVGAVSALNATFDAQRERLPGLLEVFLHAARDTDPDNPVTATWTDLRDRLTGVIDELRARALVPAWVAPGAMAALILAVAAGTVVSVTVDPDGLGHRDIASQFANLLLAARPG
ncbi:MAG TPA: TetR/AcrR family transcriptional regulator [Acidimicrobiia bacterium]|jgi:AcrR family transcriptional regulator